MTSHDFDPTASNRELSHSILACRGCDTSAMRVVAACVLAVFACNGHDSIEPSVRSDLPTAPNAPSSRTAVKPDCLAGAQRRPSSLTGRYGREIDFIARLALEGTDTVVRAADPSIKREHAGDKTASRVFISIGCWLFIEDGQSVEAANQAEENKDCKLITLDLARIDRGEPLSSKLDPVAWAGWRISSFSPDLSMIQVSNGLGSIVVTGLARDVNAETLIHTEHARVTWNASYDDRLIGAGRS